MVLHTKGGVEMNNFASMLKYFREREGLSQRELASKLGMSASAICMYENGNRQPKFEDEEAIADFFNVDLNTLRGRRTYTDADYEDISKAMHLYNAYANAAPDVRQAVEILLKTSQSIPKVHNQEPPKPIVELPHLKKDKE
jgi:transcriptional regulator with XRE-family HTH domain